MKRDLFGFSKMKNNEFPLRINTGIYSATLSNTHYTPQMLILYRNNLNQIPGVLNSTAETCWWLRHCKRDLLQLPAIKLISDPSLNTIPLLIVEHYRSAHLDTSANKLSVPQGYTFSVFQYEMSYFIRVCG